MKLTIHVTDGGRRHAGFRTASHTDHLVCALSHMLDESYQKWNDILGSYRKWHTIVGMYNKRRGLSKSDRPLHGDVSAILEVGGLVKVSLPPNSYSISGAHLHYGDCIVIVHRRHRYLPYCVKDNVFYAKYESDLYRYTYIDGEKIETERRAHSIWVPRKETSSVVR